MTLYILNYNNYYNRILKKESTLQGYLDYVIHVLTSTNFNPGDGVFTKHVFGGPTNYSGQGDYVLAVDELGQINTRWFIMDEKRTMSGQYELTLQRDVIADFYDEISTSPLFIEKGMINLEDPLIYNKENMTFNQIKKSELLLKDLSECPWLVIYYARSAAALQGTVPNPELSSTEYTNIGTNIEDWEYYDLTNLSPNRQGRYGNIKNGTYTLYAIMQNSNGGGQFTFPVSRLNSNSNINVFSTEFTPGTQYGIEYTGNTGDAATGLEEAIKSNYTRFNSIYNYLSYIEYDDNNKIMSDSEYSDFISFDNKTICDAQGRFYKVNIQSELTGSLEGYGNGIIKENIFIIASASTLFSRTASENTKAVRINITANYYTIELTPLENISLTYNITPELITSDAPYNICAIPYGQITFTNERAETLTTTSDIALQTAQAIIAQQGSNVYDVQLLPYCPIQENITGTKAIRATHEKQYSLITYQDQAKGVIFNVPTSRFELTINKAIQCADTAIQRKINNECDKWRLTAPNYSNYFDFSVEKNKGVTAFKVECEYKPITPYIHIAPDFNGLYGDYFKSPHGLVLGADFSLAQISDKWVEYQLQNKNFQTAFDRQIQSMEIQQNTQRIQDIAGASTGVLTGAASGALTGSSVGGPLGALVGAGIGAVASAVGGIVDVNINERLRAEALDFTKDNFGYQLGNIQALPITLSKISAFNPNKKLFPVLEYYTATDKEKLALINKLKYNGFTVMVIGQLNDYLGTFDITLAGETIQAQKTYLKAKLIRLEGTLDNYHIVNIISKELNQGVYI